MAAKPSLRPSIKVTFESPYRGGRKQWACRWHFTGANFTTAEFEILTDNIRDFMIQCLPPATTIVSYTGYNSGTEVPVFEKVVTTPGSRPDGGAPYAPLENVALWRYTTDQRSTKNHPIYLYKHIHHVNTNSVTDADTLNVGLKDAMTAVAQKFVDGIDDGTGTRVYCSSQGAVAQTSVVETSIHHRDFPT